MFQEILFSRNLKCAVEFNFIVLFAVRALEKAKITGNFAAETCEVTKSEGVPMPGYNDTESESSDSEASRTVRQTKKLKVAGLHH